LRYFERNADFSQDNNASKMFSQLRTVLRSRTCVLREANRSNW